MTTAAIIGIVMLCVSAGLLIAIGVSIVLDLIDDMKLESYYEGWDDAWYNGYETARAQYNKENHLVRPGEKA